MKISRRSILAATAAAGLLTACGSNSSSSTSSAAKGSVYYLNFKPEQDEVWQSIAKEYTTAKGIDVKVVTAASGTYEATLTAEVSKSQPPSLFQVNGPVGLQNWKQYTADLSSTTFYNDLLDKSMALKDGDQVLAVPYVEEGYGIIYNDSIMKKYFALSGAKVTSIDQIKDFATLKSVADDMQSKKSELGIKGVFACTSLKSGEDWRWQTHLMNIPIYYEYKDSNADSLKEITFKYNKEFKQIFDLYLTDSTIDPSLTASKSVADSMSEFALGQCAMVQNGDWAWSQIDAVKGNTVKSGDVKIIPIYTGMPDDSTQGICIGTENYWCVNTKAESADQQATIDFCNWMVTSTQGKKHMVKDLGFIPPFNSFSSSEQPSDPLAKQVISYMGNTDLKSVSWVFDTFPSEQFKTDFGQALAQYAAGKESWDKVVSGVISSWKSEAEG